MIAPQTILLILISSAMASIVDQQDKAPSDKTMQRASGVIYEALDKVSSLPMLKSEFILWATSILDELPTNKLDTIFTLVFVKGVGITGNNGAKKHSSQSEEPDLPHYRKEEQENDDFKGDAIVKEAVVTGNLLIKSISLSKIKGKGEIYQGYVCTLYSITSLNYCYVTLLFSCSVMPHVMSCHVMSCHVMSCHVHAISEVYVTLRVGDGSEWAQSTDIAPNMGVEDTVWKFEPNEMAGDVEAAYLAKNVINFTVKDSNESSADKYVGKAKLSMEELVDELNCNKLITLSGSLQSHEDPESAGEFIVKAKFIIPNADSGKEDKEGEGEEEVEVDMQEEQSD
jgi:hypothetical protein